MEDVLMLVAKTLQKLHVTWAFGGSLILKHHGLIDEVNDIDIVIEISDAHKVEKALQELGAKKQATEKKNYQTEFFRTFELQGIAIDVMANLKIKNDIIYPYHFSKSSITAIKRINGVKLNYCSLEEWLVLYYVMNRPQKVELLIDYFNNTTMFHKELFIDSLSGLSIIQKDELLHLLNKQL